MSQILETKNLLGYAYIIRTYPYCVSNSNIYKIGVTFYTPEKHLLDYPDSEDISYRLISDLPTIKNKINRMFADKPMDANESKVSRIRAVDAENGYFEGNIWEIMNRMNEVCNKSLHGQNLSMEQRKAQLEALGVV